MGRHLVFEECVRAGALVMWYLGSKGVFARCVSVLFVVVKDFTVNGVAVNVVSGLAVS